MTVQIVFQCRFIIRRGCSHSWLRAGSVMKVRCSFFGMAVVRGTRPFPRVGVSREGANTRPCSQLPPLRRVLLQQPWQWCGGQGGDGDYGSVMPQPLEITGTKTPPPSSRLMSCPYQEQKLLHVACVPHSSRDKSDFACTAGKP